MHAWKPPKAWMLEPVDLSGTLDLAHAAFGATSRPLMLRRIMHECYLGQAHGAAEREISSTPLLDLPQARHSLLTHNSFWRFVNRIAPSFGDFLISQKNSVPKISILKPRLERR